MAYQPSTSRQGRLKRIIDFYAPLDYSREHCKQIDLDVFTNTVSLYLCKDFALNVHPCTSKSTAIDPELLAHLPRLLPWDRVSMLVQGIQNEMLEIRVAMSTLEATSIDFY